MCVVVECKSYFEVGPGGRRQGEDLCCSYTRRLSGAAITGKERS